ncbi:MAG: DUF2267 domain-containing protein [Bdellovibrionota bacterium]
MTDSGLSSFDSTVEKTNHILKAIEESYGWPKERRGQSYAALKAVLHALRDRLTVDESAQLAAQLPILLRGIYYHDWNPSRVPMKMNRKEFLAQVGQHFQYSIDGGLENLVRTVLNSLTVHVSAGEWEKIRSNLPRDLATLLPGGEEKAA